MPARLLVLVAAFVVASTLQPVSAHHGWGGQQTEEFKLTGVVTTGVSLSGPHATMQIRVDTQVWDITLAPGNRTARAGLGENVIPLGSTVTVEGHRNRNPKRFEIKGERVIWNGRTFNVYPERT